MKRILFLFLIVFSTYSLYAQKVVVDGGKVVIDSRNVRPEGITSKKKWRTTNGTNSSSAAVGSEDIASQESNAKVYYYFEVAKSDSDGGSGLGWLDAVNKCATLSSNGGDWRLPTHRELTLMWVLRLQFKNYSDFTLFLADSYWSATEHNTIDSWYGNFENGNTNGSTKTKTLRVRCVRDLNPPAAR